MANNDDISIDQRILEAAKHLFTRFGYDKTTINDIAQDAGVAKSTLYLRWKTKEELLGAVIWHETRRYLEVWLARLEADPQGGTLGGIYRNALLVAWENPFLVALFARDMRVLGSYLRKPEMDGLIQQRLALSWQIFTELQAVGVVRQDIDLEAVSYLVNSLQYGLLRIDEVIPLEQSPSILDATKVMVEMLDCYLSPPGGGDSAAGKLVMRQIAARMLALLDQVDGGEGGVPARQNSLER